MTSQEIVSEAEPRTEDHTMSPALDYPAEESHWSQNHGPSLIAISAFTLLVGYGVIFFNSTAVVVDNTPLVPNNFVPDDDNATVASPAEPTTSDATKDDEPAIDRKPSNSDTPGETSPKEKE